MNNLPRRRGGVLLEMMLIVSIIALSGLIFAAVTGFGTQVAGEFSEMGGEVDLLGGPSTPTPTISAPTAGSFPIYTAFQFRGTGPAGATIRLYLNGTLYGTIATVPSTGSWASGYYWVTAPTTFTFTTTALLNGVESLPSAGVTVVYS